MSQEFNVFVLGAGASYGDLLCDEHGMCSSEQIPLVDGFFDARFFEDDLIELQESYEPLIRRIRTSWNLADAFGTGAIG